MTNKITGVIDIGSNSVRLLVVNNGKTIYKNALVTRLSENMSKERILTADAMERTISALSFFRDKAYEFSVEKLYVFATAAVRLASNKEQFLALVYNRLNINIDVISGENEAEIGLLGALNNKDGGFIDVGGKSTELAVIINGKSVYVNSFNIGIVSLREKFSQNNTKTYKYCKKFFKENLNLCKYNYLDFYAVGGTATTISAICLGLKEYDREKVDLSIVTLNQLKKVIKTLSKTPFFLRTKKFCIQKGREDVILSGSILFYALMKKLKLNKIIVRDSDNLEGYLLQKGI